MVPIRGWVDGLLARHSSCMGKRSYGSGRLFARADSGGRETWYGSWWAGEVRVKRRIGPKRRPGTADGLTCSQAERELRHLIATELVLHGAQRRTVEQGRRLPGASRARDGAQANDAPGLPRLPAPPPRPVLRRAHAGQDRRRARAALPDRQARGGPVVQDRAEPAELPQRPVRVLGQARLGDEQPGRAGRPAQGTEACARAS